MKRFTKILAAEVGIALAAALLAAPAIWPIMFADTARRERFIDLLWVVPLLSLYIFGPAFVAASAVAGAATAAVARARAPWLLWFVAVLVATLLFPAAEVGGIFLVNGPSVPLIQNATPYLIVALIMGCIVGLFSAAFARRVHAHGDASPN
jgi:hypothetical protein